VPTHAEGLGRDVTLARLGRVCASAQSGNGRHVTRISTIVRLVAMVATVAVVAIASASVGGAPAGAQDAGTGRASFAPTEPCRLLDTRTGETSPHARDGRATVWRVRTTSRCGTPDRIAAAALTVTAVRATSD